MPDAIIVHADAEHLDFAVTRSLFLQEAQDHELPVLENTAIAVRVASPLGIIAISTRDIGLRIQIETADENSLSLIRNELMTHLDYHAHDLIKDLSWSDKFTAGKRPPNFKFATVLSSQSLCEDFIRLELQMAGGDSFSEDSIHFRFAIPTIDNLDPEWPILLKNGSTLWPSGDKALHRTVYTAQNVDSENAIMTVDIFRHEGGRTCLWAENLQPSQQVALVGPGGGGALKENKIILCGDETAYPCIAHILRTLPEGAAADVILLNHGGLQDYPMPNPKGTKLNWISPDPEKSLADHAFAAIEAKQDHFLWFAASNQEVSKIRQLSKPLKLDKKRRYWAAFWTLGE